MFGKDYEFPEEEYDEEEYDEEEAPAGPRNSIAIRRAGASRSRLLSECNGRYIYPSKPRTSVSRSFPGALERLTLNEVPDFQPAMRNIVIHRWFGELGRCADSERLCRPYVEEITKEACYYIQTAAGAFAKHPSERSAKEKFLRQLLGDGFAGIEKPSFVAHDKTRLKQDPAKLNQFVVEIGPKLRHKTPWCTNVLNICESTGVTLGRIERTWRYRITLNENRAHQENEEKVKNFLYDEVLEKIYDTPINTFYDSLPKQHFTWEQVPLFTKGEKALLDANQEHEFGFDDHDIRYYLHLFLNVLKRNPTLVELCDLAQSNSEHSRHWFFRGSYVVDGRKLEGSLMDMVKDTNGPTTAQNNVIKFHDNSSAIKGFLVPVIKASNSEKSSELVVVKRRKHLLLTAETHNFPTGVEPFSGATTGTGGRIRDVMAAGRGGTVVAGTAGYAVGQLHLPGYAMPWETANNYNGYFQKPQKIIIEASNGASDYGNKFGEPVIAGFFRAFGGSVDSERREWLKPIMFSAGIGLLDEDHKSKTEIKVEDNIHIAKIGGPAYRIGIGGGSASSVTVQGALSDRTLQAVQRGDPEMGNKLNRLLRACIEHSNNPILSIHDQGAGGNANVLKEIVCGHGADVHAPKFTLGDNSLSVQELWCAEYQESNAILFCKQSEKLLETISKREKCNFDVVGEIVESDRFRFLHCEAANKRLNEPVPVEFPLGTIQDEMPMKVYNWTTARSKPSALSLKDINIVNTAKLILKLPSVASKRFLTSKVDRSVTGLIAQQQCVGQLQLPLADVAVTACSYFDLKGTATTIGEQPIITLVNPAAGARMSLMEALASMVAAPISDLKDVKCSVNWMWPAKMKGEGYAMYEACKGLCALMKLIGVAADGGKDSLSMAAQTVSDENEPEEIVKAPGTVVVSAYAPCTNICKVVTPDLKGPARGFKSKLLLVRPTSHLMGRLGGSAFAQVHGVLGSDAPDFSNEDAPIFVKTFAALQGYLEGNLIQACHDISEGGLFVCLVEMCMAGNCGAQITLPVLEDQEANVSNSEDEAPYLASVLFSEEIGWLLEVKDEDIGEIDFELTGAKVFEIGHTTCDHKVTIRESETEAFYQTSTEDIREQWEETSFRLELLQTNVQCATQEYRAFKRLNSPHPYNVNFTFKPLPADPTLQLHDKTPRVAIIREEGTNGDREMAAAFMMAGFRVDDVTTTDIRTNRSVRLVNYQGLVFPGGFSFADTLGAAVGWAATIRGNDYIRDSFAEWKYRKNTFSFAVCNGCQLTSLLGWQDSADAGSMYTQEEPPAVRYTTNNSNRFESRWCRVKIPNSKSFMLEGMEDAVLGVWVAHKEGKFQCDEDTWKTLKSENRVALRYVDYENNTTEVYPHNPNGSVDGVAGLVSKCGRHLAMMPHPERCFLPWQWPEQGNNPELIQSARDEDGGQSTAPWAKIFQNAFKWCVEHNGSI